MFGQAILGTAFHKVAEMVFTDTELFAKYIKSDYDKIDDDLEEIYFNSVVSEYNKYIMEGKRILIPGRMMVRAYARSAYIDSKTAFYKLFKNDYFKQFSTFISEMMVESVDGIINNTGYVDLVAIKEDGRYDIIDFKTGKNFELEEIEKDYQTLFYAKHVSEVQNRLPDSFKYIHYVRESNDNIRFYSVDIRDDVIEKYNAVYNKFRNDLYNCLKYDAFKKYDESQKSDFCKWCNYRKQCKEV